MNLYNKILKENPYLASYINHMLCGEDEDLYSGQLNVGKSDYLPADEYDKIFDFLIREISTLNHKEIVEILKVNIKDAQSLKGHNLWMIRRIFGFYEEDRKTVPIKGLSKEVQRLLDLPNIKKIDRYNLLCFNREYGDEEMDYTEIKH